MDQNINHRCNLHCLGELLDLLVGKEQGLILIDSSNCEESVFDLLSKIVRAYKKTDRLNILDFKHPNRSDGLKLFSQGDLDFCYRICVNLLCEYWCDCNEINLMSLKAIESILPVLIWYRDREDVEFNIRTIRVNLGYRRFFEYYQMIIDGELPSYDDITGEVVGKNLFDYMEKLWDGNDPYSMEVVRRHLNIVNPWIGLFIHLENKYRNIFVKNERSFNLIDSIREKKVVYIILPEDELWRKIIVRVIDEMKDFVKSNRICDYLSIVFSGWDNIDIKEYCTSQCQIF